MLRIDESSNTLVPQEGGFVAEPPPARAELLHLIASGWPAFAAEIGQPGVGYVAHTTEPGVDLLALDRSGGRVVLALVGDSGHELLGRAMPAAALVAGWSAGELAAMGEALSAAVPGESPRLILVAPEWDDATLAAIDWLSRSHQLDVKAYRVGSMRFGSERLLTVDAAGAQAAGEAADPAAQFYAHVQPGAAVAPAQEAPEGEPESVPPPVPAG